MAAKDSSVIAWLYPADEDINLGRASETVRMNENRLIPPQRELDDRFRSRNSTAEPEGDEDADANEDDDEDKSQDASCEESDDEERGRIDYLYSSGLQLTFTDGPENPEGFVFGTKSTCDIVLPNRQHLSGISQRQCAITFDGQGRLVLQDLRDPLKRGDGTAVSYNGRGIQKRRNFTWILSGEVARKFKNITVILHRYLRFRIVVAHHNLQPEKVAQFQKNLSLGGLNLQSGSSTAVPSGAQTPNRSPIFLDQKELGEGGFGAVTHVWNVSTGEEYARKQPSRSAHFSKRAWEKEIELMSQVSHVRREVIHPT
jgi:FHA domain